MKRAIFYAALILGILGMVSGGIELEYFGHDGAWGLIGGGVMICVGYIGLMRLEMNSLNK